MADLLPPPTACERSRELCARARLACAVVQRTLAAVAARQQRTADVLRRAAARGAPGVGP
jgi:hypothetical protein